MSLRFTKPNPPYDDLFVFQEHEYPESLPWNKEAKLNKIKYPDGHYTNQIIGVYLGDIEFGGTFYGTYRDGFDLISARERADKLEALMGKVVRIQYAVGGYAGKASTVIIENFETTMKNYFEVEYKLKLVPHEPQTRVKPLKLAPVSVNGLLDSVGSRLVQTGQKAAKIATNTVKGAQTAAKAVTASTGNMDSDLKKGLDAASTALGVRPVKPQVKPQAKKK